MEISNNEARNIIDRTRLDQAAALVLAASNAGFEVKQVTIDLSKARLRTDPYKISIPFQSIFVADASSLSANVNLIVDTIDSVQDPIPLHKKDSMEFPLAKKQAYLYWDAQTSTTITILFFVMGIFRSGSQLVQSTNAGNGSSINDLASVALTTATTLIRAAETRGAINLYNAGPDDAWIGGSAVDGLGGATPGMLLEVGGTMIYENSGAVYGVSDGTSTIHVQTET